MCAKAVDKVCKLLKRRLHREFLWNPLWKFWEIVVEFRVKIGALWCYGDRISV